ncbi:hypothetical protein D3C76_778400 [compost metagenome]
MSVSKVEVVSPPMTTMARAREMSPDSVESASGIKAPIVATAVISIGRIRVFPASIKAS